MRWTSPELAKVVLGAQCRFEQAGIASPFHDARIIAASLLDVPSHTDVPFTSPDAIPEGFYPRYEEAVSRREKREPLQHIVGTAPFGSLDLIVGSGVFIPRPETEVLAEWAVGAFEDYLSGLPDDRINDPFFRAIAIDLGTGSGALAIYIAQRIKADLVLAVEKSPAARQVAELNAGRYCDSGNVRVMSGDMTDPRLLEEYSGTVGLIVANPPYVPYTPEESGDLPPEIYFDPPEAVFSGADGMDTIAGLIPVAARLLAPGGHLGIEHDDSTAEATRRLVEKHEGFDEVTHLADLTGRNRFVTATKTRG